MDWTDPADRRVLFRGRLGEIVRQGGAFRAELRGLTEALQAEKGRVFGALCPAVLGDSRCRFDLETPGFAAEADLLALAEGGAALIVPALSAYPDGWFTEGRVAILTGPAQGLAAVVRADRAVAEGRRLDLWAAPGLHPQPGDRLRLTAGCDKRAETCRVKFGNMLNFQGFPHLPGEDWLIAAPRPGAGGGRRHGQR